MTLAGDLEGIDRFTCSVCWKAFGSPGELLLHEAAGDDDEFVPCEHHDATEGPHHSTECCYYADEYDL